ncbi:hypothetical protein Tcan_09406 [Toxocara canis]|uniref:Uncharacterized protein n=1 Tax=Toxocara canis TaxID=6265 RepID=A0A0B2URW5_TOXCA|nr:hypothetical protein Tcan_09406 [Toxocara canis]
MRINRERRINSALKSRSSLSRRPSRPWSTGTNKSARMRTVFVFIFFLLLLGVSSTAVRTRGSWPQRFTAPKHSQKRQINKMRKFSIVLLLSVGVCGVLTVPVTKKIADESNRFKRQLDLVWSNTGGGFPSLSGLGWDGHIFDPSMQGRYTSQADVVQLNF